MDLLPEELLADILRRLPPRPIAVCRSVSKELRAVVDGRGLLLAVEHRVPRGLRGFFINYVGQNEPYFFSRPERAAPRIDAGLRFLPEQPEIGQREAEHHSNGLLLVEVSWEKLYVCNPATRRWALLPPRPKGFGDAVHLVFDPTVSLHYEVISFSDVPPRPKMPIQPGIKRESWYEGYREYCCEEIKDLPSSVRAEYDHEGSIEWPPSSYVAQVLSSRTGQWEERAYVREDDVAVTLSDVWSDPRGRYAALTYQSTRCNAVCWRGALYLHCRGGFVMRLSLLEQKYQAIKTPRLDNVFTPPRLDVNDFLRGEGPHMYKKVCLRIFQRKQECSDRQKASMHLGKSEHGIYYTALRWHQLRVWVLHEPSESRPMLEWELKHEADIRPSFLRHYLRDDGEIQTSWSLDYGGEGSDDGVECGWDSSDDGVINMEGEDSGHDSVKCHNMSSKMDLLGYHPSKEIAFLGDRFEGFAYYLGSSKLRYLGTFDPVGSSYHPVASTHESFIYTPCVDDLLPDYKRHDGDLTDQEEEEEEEEEEAVVMHTDEDEDLEEVDDENFKGLEEDNDKDED